MDASSQAEDGALSAERWVMDSNSLKLHEIFTIFKYLVSVHFFFFRRLTRNDCIRTGETETVVEAVVFY